MSYRKVSNINFHVQSISWRMKLIKMFFFLQKRGDAPPPFLRACTVSCLNLLNGYYYYYYPTFKIKINIFTVVFWEFHEILSILFWQKNITQNFDTSSFPWLLDIQSLFYLLMKLFQKYIYIWEFKWERNICLHAEVLMHFIVFCIKTIYCKSYSH